MAQQKTGRASTAAGRAPAAGKAEATRRRIMTVAARLFREKGYSDTTMREIAGRCRMKAGSLYYHFASKEVLVDTILQQGLDAVVRAVKEAVAGLPETATSRQRLEAAIRAQLRAMNEIGDYALASRRVFSQISPELRAKHTRQREALADDWQTLFAEAQRDGYIDPDLDLRLCRAFVLGALHWSVEWFDPRVSPVEAVADHFVRMAFSGLSAAGAGSDAAPVSSGAARPM